MTHNGFGRELVRDLVEPKTLTEITAETARFGQQAARIQVAKITVHTSTSSSSPRELGWGGPRGGGWGRRWLKVGVEP